MIAAKKYTELTQLYHDLKKNDSDARKYFYDNCREIILRWSSDELLELLWIVEENSIPSEKDAVYNYVIEKFISEVLAESGTTDDFIRFKNRIIEIAASKLNRGFPDFWSWTLNFKDSAWHRIKKDFERTLTFWFYERGCNAAKAKDLNDKTYADVLEYIYKNEKKVELKNNNSKGLKSFFFGFAVNIWKSSLNGNTVIPDEDYDNIFKKINDTENYAITREINEHNKKLVEELFQKSNIKEIDRNILFKYYYDEKSFDEISAELNETSENCRKRAQRAKEKLMLTFNKYFEGDYKDLIF